jgi:5-methylcytosine-specific restriction endonuclease McrA
MRQAIFEKTRHFVANRAKFRCEYCQIHSDDMFLSFEIDHVIPIKHGGTNAIENLAFACPHCNQHKGSDFATVLGDEIVRLFNPRIDQWSKHFETANGEIFPKSRIGEASLKIFRFNQPDLLILRQILNEEGRYP